MPQAESFTALPFTGVVAAPERSPYAFPASRQSAGGEDDEHEWSAAPASPRIAARVPLAIARGDYSDQEFVILVDGCDDCSAQNAHTRPQGHSGVPTSVWDIPGVVFARAGDFGGGNGISQF